MSKENESYLPTWISDTEIDPQWIEQVTNLRGVSQCVVDDISNQGRRQAEIRNGATLRLHLSFHGKEINPSLTTNTLIIKQVPPSGRPQSQMLGLAREALFYQHLAPQIGQDSIPKIYHSYGNMESGSKLILMEDLSESYIDSGILFGPGNPNNWDRDLPARIAQAYCGGGGNTTTPQPQPPSSAHVARETFVAIAKVHAAFWKHESLLSHSFLRCANWIQGQDRHTWEQSQMYIQGIWNQLHQSGDIATVIHWDPLVRACLDKAMEGISWEDQQQRLNLKSHWTLVHGDFWPGNVLLNTYSSSAAQASVSVSASTQAPLKLLDWEMVGLGSGPQDLGQYILSNMEPKERRECEKSLIQDYYATLVQQGVQEYSWDECWKEYRIGGIERWLWFLVYFVGQSGPLLKWAQFFHNQIHAFLVDHDITPDEIRQPRP